MADPLDEVRDSKEYKKVLRDTKNNQDLYGKRWMKPGTSFSSIFRENHGGRFLLDWLGVGGSGLTLGAIETTLLPEYTAGSRDLLTSESRRITITALVPHPKFRDTVSLGFIDAFTRYEPPKLSIVYSKPVKLQGAEGMSYERADGSCSIVVKGEKNSLVNIETSRCDISDQLLAFAAKLDFSRFNERLNS